ncbi:uridine diphosphate-N-acetylglucosamine-binding protein YvcK [Nocardioides marmoriginsengisoli]|uniref:Putative gluconeogenesis factor n=1 Tax=Nocardioides marmoriginsengisoli TaxID=661483 RepID=A0A3N0C8Z7_9ACTN|nr:uridine diphosphate-N-acetylglucosamine-binding protein YvcK [Nocardioides marmoriginsengisoli]RNL59944.1 uridine diphosphate-N-acetylglucosamine-binding protein YvcK [Nocardioides marmoriginsengisoli]
MPWSDDPAVVALGGGHGLSASLAALRRLTSDLTAVVTVADNGGSSGRLREEFGVLPPGDLRMALASLCGDDRWGQTWAKVLQHRFSSDGSMDGHAVGNLLIVALWELLDDQVAGLDWVGGLLGARGRVLPMALTPLDIAAEVRDASGEVAVVRGQVAVATAAGKVLDVRLEPAAPEACPEAVQAIAEADWVVIGPGSWYSSVIPHLLVPGLRTALGATSARVVVNLNLVAQAGETDGYTPADHLAALHRHAPDLRVSVVLADAGSVGEEASLRSACAALGAELVLADVALAGSDGQHDPEKLARAYAAILGAN